MATAHNEADIKDISKIVIMCGDPVRVKKISQEYLTDSKLVNTVRNMYGYTGYYKDKLVTIFAHGMGNPSMGIYSYELYKDYDVDYIIRIGTTGSYDPNLNLLDIVLVDDVYSESNYGKFLGYLSEFSSSTKSINNIILDEANKNNIVIKEGRVHSTDAFYTKDNIKDVMRNKYNCLCVEMESYSLFVNSYLLNKKASCVLTVTDNLITGERLNSTNRVDSLDPAIKLVLESILHL